jgi:glutamate racemase
VFRALVGPDIQLVETGAPVARQTQRLLQAQDLLKPQGDGKVQWQTTGSPQALQAAAARWL